jgi:hypothetical protein
MIKIGCQSSETVGNRPNRTSLEHCRVLRGWPIPKQLHRKARDHDCTGLAETCNLGLDTELSLVRDGRYIARTVQNPNDNDLGFPRKMVNGIVPMEDHAQIGRKLKPRSAG